VEFRSEDVIVGPLSTVGYTSVASVFTVDSGPTNLIHELQHRCVCRLTTAIAV